MALQKLADHVQFLEGQLDGCAEAYGTLELRHRAAVRQSELRCGALLRQIQVW